MKGLILLAGASGYIGGRLLRKLENAGRPVRCLARHPEYLVPKVGAGTQVVRGDVLDASTLPAAFEGVHTVVYLVHSMAGADFETADRTAARNVAQAARAAGVRRIIYVGGLGDTRVPLSAHLRSRQEVGRVLGSTGVQITEFRASIVIGSGSLSFEMIRALVERLPVMVTPRWVALTAQPIFINDLLDYLEAALDLDAEGNRVFEIGGPDQISYGGLMREYARQRQLRRWMIPVPVLTPRLSSLWLGLVTPLYARIGRTLIDSLRHSTVLRDSSASAAFNVRPRGVREAISSALADEESEFAQTRWSDASSALGPPRQWGGVRFGNRLIDSRSTRVSVPPAAAFAPILRIGGKTGWYYGDWLWTLRGWLDLLAGGAGMRRGRRAPHELQPGDVVDCWRVEALEPGRRLRLAAEMRMPGRAWLEFEVRAEDYGSIITQTAVYDPVGLAGLVYWYALYPIHEFIFAGMLRNIAAVAAHPDGV